MTSSSAAARARAWTASNGEAFGSDTLRLKENDTRIAFTDTSAVGAARERLGAHRERLELGETRAISRCSTRRAGRHALRVFAGRRPAR